MAQSAIRAVIYARYSSHSQTEQSIEGQLRDAHAFAEREGYQVVHEYIDRAQSGTRDTRAAFQQMVTDAARRSFAVVLVWKLDRFARNRYDSAIYKARLKKCGVRVVSVMERIQDNPEGIILEGMLESMAEYYSANLSVNIRRGQRESLAKGRYPGGSVPYGFMLQEGRLVADPHRAPVVQEVFRRYAAGESMKAIIDDLTARGVRSSSGRPLTYSTFNRAFHNRTYIGECSYGGQIVPGVADQLVDEATFAAAQAHAVSCKRGPSAAAADDEDRRYLLRGKIFCGHCGASMTGESGRGRHGGTFRYYTCSARKRRHSCAKRPERRDFVEWYVVDQTVRYVLDPDRADYIAEQVVKAYEADMGLQRIQDLERQIGKLDGDVTNLVDTLTDAPKAARARIYERIEQLDAERADIQTDLDKLRALQSISFTTREVKAWLSTFSGGDPLDKDFQQRVIDTFVNAVYLFDDRLTIFYNLREGQQVCVIGEASPDPSARGSTSTALAPLLASQVEPCSYIFSAAGFGIVVALPKKSDR